MKIKGVKLIRRLRRVSQAQLMSADDGHEYIVKFQGNPGRLFFPVAVNTGELTRTADRNQRIVKATSEQESDAITVSYLL